MKKILTVLIFTLILILASLSLQASVRNGLCDCGREFASADSSEYMIHDCLGCGRNYMSCTCHTCWCGAELTRTETESGITVTTCNDCSLPCEECICRDRSYYEAVKGVAQGMSGVEVPNPDPGAVIPAVIFPFLIFALAYFTVYRRGSATRARKDRAPRLERALDRIDREPDPLKRYLLAKGLEESKRDEESPFPQREEKVLCHRKNELLAEAVEEDWVRDAVSENLRHCRMMNEFGAVGAVERTEPLRSDATPAERKEAANRTPARNLVKWDTSEPLFALWESVTPLNEERESNLLLTASNATRFLTVVGTKEPLMNRKTDPENREEILATLQRLVPEGNAELLLTLPDQPGEPIKLPHLPEEVNPKRAMGDKVRFRTGGMQE